MKNAQKLIGMGLHPSDIVRGYEIASKKALEILEKVALRTEILFPLHDGVFFVLRVAILCYFSYHGFCKSKRSIILFLSYVLFLSHVLFFFAEIPIHEEKNLTDVEKLGDDIRTSISSKQPALANTIWEKIFLPSILGVLNYWSRD